MNLRMLPRRSSSVCIFAAALVVWKSGNPRQSWRSESRSFISPDSSDGTSLLNDCMPDPPVRNALQLTQENCHENDE